MKLKPLPIKIIALIVVLCSRSFVSANDQYDNRALNSIGRKKVSVEDDSDMLENLTKQMQELLSRIEVLEHNLSILQHKVDSTNQISAGSVESSQQRDSSAMPSDKEIDVFTSTSEVVNSNSIGADVGQDKKQYDLALAALKGNNLKEAENKFHAFLENYPNSKLRGNAYFWYGEVFFKQKIYDKASINYLKGYKQFPKGPKASDSLLKLSLSLGELNKKKESCNIINKLETEFPSRSASSVKRAKDAKIKFGCK
jgi:tol-pal system protein YbgF